MVEWISVEDRLPTDLDDWVLISYVDQINHELRFVPSIGKLRDGIWVTLESEVDSLKRKEKVDFEKDYLVKVTHWMPLPDSPKD